MSDERSHENLDSIMTPVSAYVYNGALFKIILVKCNYSIRNIYGERILQMTLEHLDDNAEFVVPKA